MHFLKTKPQDRRDGLIGARGGLRSREAILFGVGASALDATAHYFPRSADDEGEGGGARETCRQAERNRGLRRYQR